jgi:hypothetical protein
MRSGISRKGSASVGIRSRLNRLRERSGFQKHALVCPECREEFVCYGDVAMEYMVASYVRKTGETGRYREPPDITTLFEHEHGASNFLDKPTGLPFLSREVSGVSFYTDEDD